jgi:hypothetical protein
MDEEAIVDACDVVVKQSIGRKMNLALTPVDVQVTARDDWVLTRLVFLDAYGEEHSVSAFEGSVDEDVWLTLRALASHWSTLSEQQVRCVATNVVVDKTGEYVNVNLTGSSELAVGRWTDVFAWIRGAERYKYGPAVRDARAFQVE